VTIVERAMERAEQSWHRGVSHIDCESAYRDRRTLAVEVERLRAELVATERLLRETEQELVSLETDDNRHWFG
jgi:hypothetical protein